MTTKRTFAIGAALLLAAALETSAAAGTMFRLEVGPPVAAGTNLKTKGALLAVRAVICDDLANVRVMASAETAVNGSRRSTPLQVMSMTSAGVYTVQMSGPGSNQSAVPPSGRWILHLSGTCPSPKGAASTIVPMQGTTFIREKTQVLREPATTAQIEAALKELLRAQS
jgi:hypothetical protein